MDSLSTERSACSLRAPPLTGATRADPLQPDALLDVERAKTISGQVLTFTRAEEGGGVVVSLEGQEQGAGGILAGGIPIKMGPVSREKREQCIGDEVCKGCMLCLAGAQAWVQAHLLPYLHGLDVLLQVVTYVLGPL